MEIGRGGSPTPDPTPDGMRCSNRHPESSGVLKEELKVKGLGFFLLFVRAYCRQKMDMKMLKTIKGTFSLIMLHNN